MGWGDAVGPKSHGSMNHVFERSSTSWSRSAHALVVLKIHKTSSPPLRNLSNYDQQLHSEASCCYDAFLAGCAPSNIHLHLFHYIFYICL